MKITVHVDTSEQVPLIFPRVLVVRPRRAYRQMRTITVTAKRKNLRKWGCDYAVDGFYDVSRIERKRGMDELHKNIWTSDYGRSMNSFDRLVDGCQFPYLVLEKSAADLYRHDDLYPGDVLSHLLRELHRRRIGFHAVGRAESRRTRMLLGDFTLRLMLSHTDLLYDR